MTLEELENNLPWGFHDAVLESIEVDWMARRALLVVRLKMDERQTLERRARVLVTGLEYVAVDPPASGGHGAEHGLWIDAGCGHAPERAGDFLATPGACFVHWLFVHEWNAFIHICAREASMEWTDPAPLPVRRSTGFALPGDEVDLG